MWLNFFAHLRANPPMPYKVRGTAAGVNELAGIRGALQQLAAHRAPREQIEPSLRENILRLLPALKQIRDKVQYTLGSELAVLGGTPCLDGDPCA
jgi:hypothetical protein